MFSPRSWNVPSWFLLLSLLSLWLIRTLRFQTHRLQHRTEGSALHHGPDQMCPTQAINMLLFFWPQCPKVSCHEAVHYGACEGNCVFLRNWVEHDACVKTSDDKTKTKSISNCWFLTWGIKNGTETSLISNFAFDSKRKACSHRLRTRLFRHQWIILPTRWQPGGAVWPTSPLSNVKRRHRLNNWNQVKDKI